MLFAAVAPEILAPEVEDISEQVDGCGILLHLVEHGDDGLLMSDRVVNRPRTKVCVGEEVEHILDRFAVVCSSLVLLAVDRFAVRLEEAEFEFGFFRHHIFVPLRVKDNIDINRFDAIH